MHFNQRQLTCAKNKWLKSSYRLLDPVARGINMLHATINLDFCSAGGWDFKKRIKKEMIGKLEVKQKNGDLIGKVEENKSLSHIKFHQMHFIPSILSNSLASLEVPGPMKSPLA